MKIISWIADADSADKEVAVGGLGGSFAPGNRWQDFVDNCKPETHEYLEAIREYMLSQNKCVTAYDHQNSLGGVPMFEDGKVAIMSMRMWGDMMAAIKSTQDNQDYSYLDFWEQK